MSNPNTKPGSEAPIKPAGVAPPQSRGSTPAAAVPAPADNIPSYMHNVVDYSTENLSGNDLRTPRIMVVQGNSNMLNPNDKYHVEGATPGALVHTGAGKLLPNPVEFIQCYYLACFYVLKKYADNRNPDFIGRFLAKTDAEAEVNYLRGQEGDPNILYEIIDAREHFGIVNSDAQGAWLLACLNMTSTKMNPSRDMMGIINSLRYPDGKQVPSYAVKFLIGSRMETNANKQSYQNFTVQRVPGWIDEALFKRCHGEQMRTRQLERANHATHQVSRAAATLPRADNAMAPATAGAPPIPVAPATASDIPF